MHSKNDSIEIIINNKVNKVIKDLFDHLKIDTKIIRNQWKVVSLSSIMFIYCIINAIK